MAPLSAPVLQLLALRHSISLTCLRSEGFSRLRAVRSLCIVDPMPLCPLCLLTCAWSSHLICLLLRMSSANKLNFARWRHADCAVCSDHADQSAQLLSSASPGYRSINMLCPLCADRETQRPRGFGFVTMEAEAAKNAIAGLNNTDFEGRTIRVNEAAPPGEGELVVH